MAKGVDFIVKVQTGTDSTTGDPIYNKILGQRGGTLNRGNGTLDVTTKDSLGFDEFDYGNGNWSISASGVLDEADSAITSLDDAWINQTTLLVQWVYPSGKAYEGDALVTDFPVDAPHDGIASYSLTLTGTGKPTAI